MGPQENNDIRSKSLNVLFWSILALALMYFGYQFLSTRTNKNRFCIQKIQRACFMGTSWCKDFPTPCDVPAGWKPQEPYKPQPVSEDRAYQPQTKEKLKICEYNVKFDEKLGWKMEKLKYQAVKFTKDDTLPEVIISPDYYYSTSGWPCGNEQCNIIGNLKVNLMERKFDAMLFSNMNRKEFAISAEIPHITLWDNVVQAEVKPILSAKWNSDIQTDQIQQLLRTVEISTGNCVQKESLDQ